MATDTPAKTQTVSARYTSPTNQPFTHVQKLAAPPSDKPSDRTTYLHALRQATATMQEQINKELTQRMEEDKAKESAGLNGTSKAKAQDIAETTEEDNYGEEQPDEED